MWQVRNDFLKIHKVAQNTDFPAEISDIGNYVANVGNFVNFFDKYFRNPARNKIIIFSSKYIIHAW